MNHIVSSTLRRCIFPLLFFFVLSDVFSQNPKRFASEITAFDTTEALSSNGDDVVVFTGSSSIRMWANLKQAFPKHFVLNRGFGGSHFSDLLFYLDELVLRYKPTTVFIYEGDNDIDAGKNPKTVFKDAKEILKRTRKELPVAKVVFIAAKPSIARWHLKEKYEDLNGRLEKLAGKKKLVAFADVWTAMLDENGVVRKDIFINDGLHMNEKGYEIWRAVLTKHL